MEANVPTAVWTRHERVALVERASTIDERLGSGYELAPLDVSSPQVQQRLARWCEVVAKGDRASFERSLMWQGREVTTVARALVPPRLSDGDRMPDWVETIEAIIRAGASAGTAGTDEIVDLCGPDRPIPFAPFYLPFVQVARQRFARDLASAGLQQLTIRGSVRITLEQALVRSLAFLCAKTLSLEFDVFAAQSGQWLFGTPPAGLQDLEWAFARRVSSSGLKSFMSEYCVLARQTATMVMRWSRVAVEFFARLHADRSAVCETFCAGQDAGELAILDIGLSDPHHDGRSVFRLTFSSGVRLIYKPRAVSPDLSFYGLLEWLNVHGVAVPFRIVKYVDRGAYGWVEHVDHAPCHHWPQLQAFARGAGAILCVAHILQSTDLHDGNLIADQGGPILVDLETLMAPHLSSQVGWDGGTAHARAEQLVAQSVARTALLPQWRFGPNQEAADIGGLGDLCGPLAAAWYERSPEANPVGQELSSRFVQASLGDPDAQSSVGALVDDVVDGFERTYRFLMANRDDLLAAGGPLESFKRIPVRFLLRDTTVYLGILRRSFAPECMRDAADWSIELESVTRVLHVWQTPPSFLQLLRAEAQSMSTLNVPYFATAANRVSLGLADGVLVRNLFAKSSYRDLRARVQALGEEHLQGQIELIRTSFAVRHAGRPHQELALRVDATRSSAHMGASTQDGTLMDAAFRIAETIERRAIRGDDGSLSWIAVVPAHEAGSFQLGVGVTDFPAGSTGVAVFLAAIATSTGSTRLRDAARGSLRSIAATEALATEAILVHSSVRQQFSRSANLGITLYGLTKAGELLGEPEWIQVARRLGSVMDERVIGASRSASLNQGTAGTLLGLLALATHDTTGRSWEQAIECGRQLLVGPLAQASTSRDQTAGAPGKAGVASGIAGIAYALVRLAEATRDPTWLGPALQAMQTVHDANNNIELNGSWCEGIVGIGLVCLRCPALSTRPEATATIDAALTVAMTAPLGGLDTLCCGTFGRVELLLEASRRLRRPELGAAATALARQAIDAAAATGGYRLFARLPRSVFSPALFYGQAGIGYTLLRLQDPSLPSLLLFE